MGVNITEVRFLNVPLENDYKHTLWFATKSAQENYFASKVVKTMDKCSYQRKDKIIRASFHIDTMYNCNYVMYKNKAYGDRWFYAFITDMEYVDDGRTDIHIETDVMQTWKFDVTIRPSFVEREHVTDDTVGLHTVPEQLETGEYVCNGSDELDLTEFGIVIGSTVNLGEIDKEGKCSPIIGGRYNNIYSGVKYYYFSDQHPDEYKKGVDALNYVLQLLADKGQSDAITCMFLAPSFCCPLYPFTDTEHNTLTSSSGEIPVLLTPIKDGTTATIKDWDLNKPTKLITYTPKNNKLFCYPYSYMMLSNHNGNNALYRYELFNTATKCTFRTVGAITPGCSIRMFPTNYMNEYENYEEGITGGKFPICNWITDVYTNWLTQNSINIASSFVGSAVQIGSGITMTALGFASGQPILGASGIISTVGGVNGVLGNVGEIYQHSKIPPQSEGNLNSGDVCFSNGNLTFKAYHKCIRPEFAEIIDGYFTMFGYKVNVVKTPNTNHRNNFWFTKTVDVNIDGAIPNKDMQRIKDVYNAGVTFWRYPANIGNYDVDNSIL